MKYWKKKDADLIPENIKEGIEIDGVTGTFKGIDIQNLLGYSKMAVDKFTLSSNGSIPLNISHSLGVKPTFAILLTDFTAFNGSNYNKITMFYVLAKSSTNKLTGAWARYNDTYSLPEFYGTGDSQSSGWTNDWSTTEIKIYCSGISGQYLKSGIEYTLLTFA